MLEGFIATLQAQAEPISLNAAVDLLKDRYDAQNALTPKIAVPDIIRLLVMSNALAFAGGQASSDAPVRNVEGLALADLAHACETVYLWRLVEGGVPVIAEQLAPVLYETGADTNRVQELCRGLVQRHMIVPMGDSFAVAPEQISRLVQRDELVLVAADLARVALPSGEPVSPVTPRISSVRARSCARRTSQAAPSAICRRPACSWRRSAPGRPAPASTT